MASKSSETALDHLDFFPFRGQYGGSSAGAALFIAVRSTVPIIIYSLLVPASSSLSLASRFPWAAPSSFPTGPTSIPFVPEVLLHSMKQHLNLAPYPVLIFLGALLPSFSFLAYNALWRREKFPLTGQGGSVQVTTQVNMINVIHRPALRLHRIPQPDLVAHAHELQSHHLHPRHHPTHRRRPHQVPLAQGPAQ